MNEPAYISYGNWIPEHTVRLFEVGEAILERLDGEDQKRFAKAMASAWEMATCPLTMVQNIKPE